MMDSGPVCAWRADAAAHLGMAKISWSHGECTVRWGSVYTPVVRKLEKSPHKAEERQSSASLKQLVARVQPQRRCRNAWRLSEDVGQPHVHENRAAWSCAWRGDTAAHHTRLIQQRRLHVPGGLIQPHTIHTFLGAQSHHSMPAVG